MTSPIITEALRALVERRNLTRIEAAAAMEAIMSGTSTNAQIAAFLTALRMKGETVEELIGFAQVMRAKAVRIRTRPDDVAGLTGTDRDMLIDTCGTGGDARDGRPRGVQQARAGDEPGRSQRAGDRGLLAHAHRAARACPRRARYPPGLRRPRRRRPRRDLEHRRESCLRGPWGRGAHHDRAPRGLRVDARVDRRPAGR